MGAGAAPSDGSASDTLTYNSYLRVPQLLDLQQYESDPPAHDELLFIIIHQAYELWFKLILFELDSVRAAMYADDVYEASRLLQRVLQIERLLIDQIHVLETMTPRDFLRFRAVLNPASGFQSIQFREVEFLTGIKDSNVLKYIELTGADRERLERRLAEPSIRHALFELLRRRGFDVVVPHDGQELVGDERDQTFAELLRLYQHPEKFFHLYTLAEALVEHDQNLLLWRFHHVRVVERLIGTKAGTGGSSGVQYLSSTLTKRAYPMLWEVRGMLSDTDIYESHTQSKR
ncbi:MAG: tryptophan 2,3-dioxygenase [Bradymonadaceae bacterium]|nr:tryptophan 2,3-dioxygenase [Lujinxingiaceae bacterium]